MIPDNYTIQELMISTGDGHELYVQDWGNPDAATPVIFLHGGPGAASSDRHKGYFDPTSQRVIFFDQRGAGRSTPTGSLKHNTTQHLVADIQLIAEHFKLDSFILTGRSWGSCLALVYSYLHPEQVAGLVIGGVFTARNSEIDFTVKGGFRPFYPEVWADFCQTVPASYRDNPFVWHEARILGDDTEKARESAFAVSNMENALLRLDDRSYRGDFESFDPSGTIIETYYMTNKCFIDDGIILKNAALLTMPVTIIQGRYDMVCPPETAYELAKKLPHARLIWTLGGHSGNDRETWQLTRQAIREMTGTGQR